MVKRTVWCVVNSSRNIIGFIDPKTLQSLPNLGRQYDDIYEVVHTIDEVEFNRFLYELYQLRLTKKAALKRVEMAVENAGKVSRSLDSLLSTLSNVFPDNHDGVRDLRYLADQFPPIVLQMLGILKEMSDELKKQ